MTDAPVLSDAQVAEIRHDHTPMPDPGCSCGRWVCAYDRDLWPCGAERWVRNNGVKPIPLHKYNPTAIGDTV